MMAAFEITTVAAGGLAFRCRTAGPVGGEPIICLHGFPETSISFSAVVR